MAGSAGAEGAGRCLSAKASIGILWRCDGHCHCVGLLYAKGEDRTLWYGKPASVGVCYCLRALRWLLFERREFQCRSRWTFGRNGLWARLLLPEAEKVAIPWQHLRRLLCSADCAGAHCIFRLHVIYAANARSLST